MDESAVALAMVAGIPLADVLFLSAKGNGGFDAGGTGQCTYIVPSFKPEPMRKFFQQEAARERFRLENYVNLRHSNEESIYDDVNLNHEQAGKDGDHTKDTDHLDKPLENTDDVNFNDPRLG